MCSLEGVKGKYYKWVVAVLIIMTDYAEVHTAVESMKLGSLELVEDKLIPLLHSIIKEREQKRQRQVPIFIRQVEACRNIKIRVHLVAPTRMSVLILGENGTGKEHISRNILTQSRFSDKPFVTADCGSLASALAPSAFFGHVKGGGAGADCNRVGYFRETEGGMLFLDEVGNLIMEMQQMLLRAIQERRYRPVGAKRKKTAKRIIAVTNENLHDVVKKKRFRQDLLYRLREYSVA